jgi:hypothetical protein
MHKTSMVPHGYYQGLDPRNIHHPCNVTWKYLAEAVLLAWEQHQRCGQALRLQRIVHVHGLVGRHHLVFLPLH